MKILLVNQYAIPPQQAGPMRHFTLARELVQLGHDVTIVASSFDHVTRQETRLRPHEKHQVELIDGVRFLWLRTPPYSGNGLARIWNMLVFTARVWQGMGAQSLGRPDVIIGSSPHLFGALGAEIRARHLRVPFVLEVRDLWPQSLVDLANMSERHPIVLALEVIERYLYRRARRIIALLPGASEPMVAKGAKRAKIVWIPNGVDLAILPASNASPQGAFTLMYAGTHGLANGLDLVLDGAKLLLQDTSSPKVRFILLGDGPNKAHLMERVRAEGLTNVEFLAAVPKNQVYALLQQAHGFLLILKDSPVFRWGVSPNKLFDYFAMGRPVLFGVNTPYNPVAESGAGLTFAPGDPAAFVAAVKELASRSVAERTAMGEAGQKHVREHYDFQRLALKLEATLQDVLRGEGTADVSQHGSSKT
ncbi:glycosyltransferase family 4 protein [Deinococcus aerolatus]|uniref:glycosyltransferase family 4 protein n=1 Tax=Deinococcus aerolatus TaxID=522487 RepID=UPI0016666FAD|nr:glycosyltransferase family 4 protein [Deinococcus aerolatus]